MVQKAGITLHILTLLPILTSVYYGKTLREPAAGISEEVFSLALRGFSKLQASNKLSKDSILAIV